MSDTQNVARVVLAVGCENEKTIYLSISSYKSWLSLSGILKFHDTHQSRGCRQGKKITCLCWYTNVRWYAGQLHCLEFYSCTSLKHTRTASIETTGKLKIQNIPSKPNPPPTPTAKRDAASVPVMHHPRVNKRLLSTPFEMLLQLQLQQTKEKTIFKWKWAV